MTDFFQDLTPLIRTAHDTENLQIIFGAMQRDSIYKRNTQPPSRNMSPAADSEGDLWVVSDQRLIGLIIGLRTKDGKRQQHRTGV